MAASKDFSQDRDQQRSAEDTVEILTISLAEKVVEIPDIQTRGKTYQGVNTHIQHIVHTVDVENHIIQEKTNQMTKHVPRVQFVEKTVESAQLQIIEKIEDPDGPGALCRARSAGLAYLGNPQVCR